MHGADMGGTEATARKPNVSTKPPRWPLPVGSACRRERAHDLPTPHE
jgi:hypothetical protein